MKIAIAGLGYQDPHVDNARFKLHYGDLCDTSNLTRIIQQVQPDEVYNLGAQSHVAVSFESPKYTADIDGLLQETPQRETTPFYPRSPYAVAKMYAYWITVKHPRRHRRLLRHCERSAAIHNRMDRHGTSALAMTKAANISQGLEECLYMGNIDALGMQLRWQGEGVNEVGYWVNRHCERSAAIHAPRKSRSSKSTPATSAPPKSKPCSATQAKPNKNSAGCRDHAGPDGYRDGGC